MLTKSTSSTPGNVNLPPDPPPNLSYSIDPA
jgi:hypothetical protein